MVLLTGNGLRTVTVSKTIGCSNSKNLCLSNRENDNHNYELAPTSEKSKFSNLLYGVVRTSSSVLIPVLLGSTKSLASDEPVITDKIYMDIKIANYTEESIGKNKGASGSGRIVIGLYGKAAPESVKIFLDTIKSDGKESPTYYNSLFSRISDEGLLEIEKIRGVNTITLAGSEQLEYAGNVLDYKPILETNSIKHDRAGLLTRRQLSPGPEFAITLKPSEQLDSFHVVFGTILEGLDVLKAIEKIPVYTYTTSTGYGGKKKGAESGLADKWFEGQKSFYVGVGKSFGDMRAIDRRGKLLRRVTIKDIGVL